MKKIFNFLNLSSAFLMLSVISTGCLKDELVEDGLAGPEIYKSPSLIEIMGPTSATTGYNSVWPANLPFSNNDTTFTLLTVRLAANEPAPEDIVVTLDTTSSAALISAYNDSAHTHYEAPPNSIYKLPNGLTATIPKGSREGYLRMTLKSSDLLNKEYAIGFKLNSISNPAYGISGNWSNQVVLIGVKNKYDAVYTRVSRMRAPDRPTVNTSTSFEWPYDISMITAGNNAVKMFAGGYEIFALPIETNTGGLSRFGNVEPRFIFDLATDKIIEVKNDLVPNSQSRTLELDPSVTTSRFDPATRNIYVTYFLVQPGFTKLQISDTLTFVRER